MEDHTSDNHPKPNKNLRLSASNPRESAVKKGRSKKGTWGGRRPGAGAPKGNLNGLKHGMRSKQLGALAAYLARNPKIGAIIAAHARRRGIQEQRLEKLASRFLGKLVVRRLDLDEDQEQDLRRIAREMIDD